MKTLGAATGWPAPDPLKAALRGHQLGHRRQRDEVLTKRRFGTELLPGDRILGIDHGSHPSQEHRPVTRLLPVAENLFVCRT